MEISKKEKTFLIILGILIGLFVYFMPSIDSYMTKLRNNKGVKKSKTEQKNETVKEETNTKKEIINTYSCTLKKTDETTKTEITKEVVFTIKEGEVSKFVLTTTSGYKDITLYNAKKSTLITQQTGVEIVNSNDDKNMVYTEKITKDITKMTSKTNLEYPIKKTDLEKYVDEEGYNCSYSK